MYGRLSPGKTVGSSLIILHEVEKLAMFDCDNTTLGEIVKTLQRWYNIEVEFIRPELEHLRFTGDLSRYDSFDAVIRMFEDTKKLNMSVISNRLIVDRK